MPMTKGMTPLTNTGMHGQDMKEWRHKNLANETWENCKIHFCWAHHELKKDLTTTGQAGHNATDHAVFPPIPM